MKHRLLAALVSVAVIVAGVAVAAQGAPSGVDPTGCRPGVVVELYGDGTWVQCQQPTPTPSATPSPTPSATTTGTPSTTTTPAPTSAAPTPTSSPTLNPTTTPGPTPTGRLTNCMTRLDQCGYPHPGNTGVPAGVTLTNYTGPYTITTPGTVIDGKRLTECVYVKALGVVIRNSLIVAAGCHGNVSVDGGTVTIEDTTIDCVDLRGTGVDDHNFIARRVEIDNCQNGFDVIGDNVLVVDSYITGVGGGDGHGDGLQMNHGANITLRHNTFDLSGDLTSSLILGYYTTNLTVERNFFSGGAYSVYCTRENTNSVYRDNRFYRYAKGLHATDSRAPDFGYSTNCVDPGITWTGNYADHDLSAVGAA